MQEPLVSICCICYNQEQYIRQALEGFVMQQTNFPFEIVISDDCSKDRTRIVIAEYKEKYPELIRDVSPEKNMGSMANFLFVQAKANGKYIALCEGDDYWTDPYKLQKQVDFLEEHEDYSICFHKCSVLNVQTGVLRQEEVRDIQGESSIIDVAEGNYIHTLSVVYRTDIRLSIDREKISKNLAVGDYILWLLLAQYGRIWKMPDVMGVYREQCGIWSSQKCSYTQPRWVELLHHMVNYFEPRNLQVSELLMKQMIDAIALPMADYEQQVEKLTRELLNVHHSKAYRLGNCILKPLKLIFRK